jgi:outer membrane protein TolC
VRSAIESLRAGEEQVRVAREGVDLAGNELEHARRRYDAGVTTGLEVTDAQTRVERALDNQTVALYNYNLARVDLAQAMGKVREMTR